MSDILRDNLSHIKIPSGKYVLAVSGGVDSMVLLDILSRQSNLELIVAHFNHGIRKDSSKDEELVEKVSNRKGLVLEVGYGNLDANSSEDAARTARYKFLNNIRRKHQAISIVTAHHQDDLIETAIINIFRGSNRKGLSSMLNNKIVLRPFLNVRKHNIVRYATRNNLQWREDSTNSDTKYLRNLIRKNLQSSKESAVDELLKNIDNVAKLNKKLDYKLATLSQKIMEKSRIDRSLFTLLPPNIAKELLVFWLKELQPVTYDSPTIERLYIKLKTAPHQSKHHINSRWLLVTDKDKAYFSNNRAGRLI